MGAAIFKYGWRKMEVVAEDGSSLWPMLLFHWERQGTSQVVKSAMYNLLNILLNGSWQVEEQFESVEN